jgi:hypothetical protein
MESRDFVRLGVIYQVEKSQGIPVIDLTGYRDLLEPEIRRMVTEGFLAIEGEKYLLGIKGVELRNRMLQALDQVRPFEIFANVRLDLQLTSDQSPDEIHVYDDIHDPRFREGTDGEDLRLCMYELFGREAELGEINFLLIVFLQKLLDDEFTSPGNFWPNLKLGQFEKEAQKIIETSVTLQDIDPKNEGIAAAVYTAGTIEYMKKMGTSCSYCKTPLAILDKVATDEGRSLDSCPKCKRHFVEGAKTGQDIQHYECPACGGTVYPGDAVCSSCGAIVDFTEPPGSVRREVVHSTVVVNDWYEPATYYYDPFDVAFNTLAFAILLDAVW